jgi:hypothetical protein
VSHDRAANPPLQIPVILSERSEPKDLLLHLPLLDAVSIMPNLRARRGAPLWMRFVSGHGFIRAATHPKKVRGQVRDEVALKSDRLTTTPTPSPAAQRNLDLRPPSASSQPPAGTQTLLPETQELTFALVAIRDGGPGIHPGAGPRLHTKGRCLPPLSSATLPLGANTPSPSAELKTAA